MSFLLAGHAVDFHTIGPRERVGYYVGLAFKVPDVRRVLGYARQLVCLTCSERIALLVKRWN